MEMNGKDLSKRMMKMRVKATHYLIRQIGQKYLPVRQTYIFLNAAWHCIGLSQWLVVAAFQVTDFGFGGCYACRATSLETLLLSLNQCAEPNDEGSGKRVWRSPICTSCFCWRRYLFFFSLHLKVWSQTVAPLADA